MTYDGWLALGGNEIVNSERARGYAESAACPMYWLKDRDFRCASLSDSLSDGATYAGADITAAPWYDLSLHDVSTRFFGVYGLSIAGVEDSTRVASKQEGTGDGGVLGRARRAIREVRVKALLMGEGQDAVEYGMAWVNAVLAPYDCREAGGDCGTAVMSAYGSCPPERGLVYEYGASWVDARKNVAMDPLATNTSMWDVAAGTLSEVATGWGVSADAIRHTRNAGGAARLAFRIGQSDYLTATTYVVRMQLRASEAMTGATLKLRPTFTTTTGEVSSPSFNIPAGTSEIAFAITTSGTAATSTAGAALVWSTGATTSTLDVTDVVVEAGSSQGFFSGDSPDTETEQYEWVGTVNASASQQQTRTSTLIPQTDEQYQVSVDAVRRFMRDTGAISGAFKTNEMTSGPFWAYEIEFTLAGGPSIFGITKPLVLAPTLPTVYQDIPYNLVPYPNVALASGNVVVATNLSTNPSVEVDATDWAAVGTVVSGTSPAAFLTGARSTDLAAIGGASYRVRLLGNNGTTPVAAAVSTIEGYQEAAISAGSNRRISLNMWSAILILSGSSPGTLINSLNVTYEFFNGSTSLGAATSFGTAGGGDYGGKAYSAKAIAVPATATKVRVRAIANVTWTSAAGATNSDIRLYADALAVTVP